MRARARGGRRVVELRVGGCRARDLSGGRS